jgi:hypothetical protein
MPHRGIQRADAAFRGELKLLYVEHVLELPPIQLS